jgi:hypothetical protein
MGHRPRSCARDSGMKERLIPFRLTYLAATKEELTLKFMWKYKWLRTIKTIFKEAKLKFSYYTVSGFETTVLWWSQQHWERTHAHTHATSQSPETPYTRALSWFATKAQWQFKRKKLFQHRASAINPTSHRAQKRLQNKMFTSLTKEDTPMASSTCRDA